MIHDHTRVIDRLSLGLRFDRLYLFSLHNEVLAINLLDLISVTRDIVEILIVTP